MKAGWSKVEIGKIAELRGRIGWKGLTAKEYTDRGPLFLSVHSLNYGDYVDYRDAFHISLQRYDESPEIKIRPDDILICKDGAGIGKAGIVGQVPAPTTINSSLLLIRPGECVVPKYLYFCLTSPYFQEIVQSRLEGATTPHLYQRDITTFPIPLPPLEEQQRIVAILDETFEGLERARANAEANSHNARELFDNSLIRLFEEIEVKAARLTLAQASTSFGRGRSRHRPRNAPFLYGGIYPFVQTGDIRNSDGTVLEFSQTYSEHGLAQSKLWPAGTICITIAANIAETAVLGFDACFPDSIVGMVADPKVTFPEYVEYMLRYFAAELKALGKGSAQDNINLATFENATFPFPSIENQRQAVETLTQLSRDTAFLFQAYQAKLKDIAHIRQSLLQKAFAGELT
ncbi:restriction endonuclease subunit S [Ensifer adhaerens]|uniref:restriction endonuclease subunit S n=1 Tax=Ensifer adhaerens TaxID=106592 RepID=UPI0021018618|nr:restriction endonuclease subunit S [Ensifer adhaerens]UTV38020.1 restriction endonuclease subunit S [Ensifer adhaerens]